MKEVAEWIFFVVFGVTTVLIAPFVKYSEMKTAKEQVERIAKGTLLLANSGTGIGTHGQGIEAVT